MADLSQYVTFYSNDRLFGIDIRLVNEVNPGANVNIVPLTDEHIRGLVNIRGQVVMVIDIAVIFGYEARSITGNSHIVILKTIQDLKRVSVLDPETDLSIFGDKPIGILADKVGEVVVVQDDEIESAPPHVEENISKFIEGVVKLKEQLLIIIKPGRLLEYRGENLPRETAFGRSLNIRQE